MIEHSQLKINIHVYNSQLTVNVGVDEYFATASTASGVLLLIHSQDRMPFPSDEGLIAQPGSILSVGVVKVT